MHPIHRRWAAALVLLWTATLLSPADAAPRAPALVVVYAPPSSPPEVASAISQMAEVARERGAVFVDLSSAPLPVPTAKSLLRRGMDGYDAFRYDEAYAALEAALTEAAQSGAADLSSTELSDLLLYRALVHSQRGDATKAWDDMIRAAVVNPTRILDALRYPPRAVDAFGRATLAVRQGEKGQFVFAAPKDAHVFLDGRDVTAELPGPAPCPFGEHYVRIERQGALPYGALLILAEAQHPVTPHQRPPSPPTETDIRRLSRERGAQAVVVAIASVSADAAPTLSLRLFDVPSGAALEHAGVALAPGGAANPDVARATARLLAPPVPAAVPLVAPAPRPPIYLRPWFWGAAGVATTLAVVLPVLLIDKGSNGLNLVPRGEIPWP